MRASASSEPLVDHEWQATTAVAALTSALDEPHAVAQPAEHVVVRRDSSREEREGMSEASVGTELSAAPAIAVTTHTTDAGSALTPSFSATQPVEETPQERGDLHRARQEEMRKAVFTLRCALGSGGAGTQCEVYCRHVEQWERGLDFAAKLAPFPPTLRKAGQRLPAAKHEARDAFAKQIRIIKSRAAALKARDASVKHGVGKTTEGRLLAVKLHRRELKHTKLKCSRGGCRLRPPRPPPAESEPKLEPEQLPQLLADVWRCFNF